MFCKCCCRPRRRNPEDNKNTPKKQMKTPEEYGDNNVRVQSIHKIDEQLVNILEKDLTETPEWFVLNNVLMSMQFFENYQK